MGLRPQLLVLRFALKLLRATDHRMEMTIMSLGMVQATMVYWGHIHSFKYNSFIMRLNSIFFCVNMLISPSNLAAMGKVQKNI